MENTAFTLTEEEKREFLKGIKEFKSVADRRLENGNEVQWDSSKTILQPIASRFNLTLRCRSIVNDEYHFCSIRFGREKDGINNDDIDMALYYFQKEDAEENKKHFMLTFYVGKRIEKNQAVQELWEAFRNKSSEMYDEEPCFYYNDIDELSEKFFDDFLFLVEKFNSYKPSDFKPQEISEKSLGKELRIAYENAPENEKVTSIHIFGITHWKTITKNKFSLKTIVKEAGIADSYTTELSKMIKVGEKLSNTSLGVMSFKANVSGNKNLNHPLNQILYGPPGTGKTYNTINKALEIILQEDQTLEETKKNKIENTLKGLEENPSDKKIRKEAKELFDEFRAKGQIAFVTFHQSYGYEEFVEGIKPVMESNENGELKYEIQPGIFKKLCSTASYIEKRISVDTNSNDYSVDTNSKVWKISLGANTEKNTSSALQKYCFENGEIRIGWSDAPFNKTELENLEKNHKSSIQQFKEEMQIGDLVCVLDGEKTIKAVGVIISDAQQTPKEEQDNRRGFSLKEFQTYRKVKWIDKETRNIIHLNDNVKLTQKTVYPLRRIPPFKLLDLFDKKTDEQTEVITNNANKPYILIIDEINRGNISKIFGELITLIEKDKRIGNSEELTVKLPYSQEEFGVPSNLYIIGTMNTADRSITSLDTALRRRFEFIEMMPNPEILSQKKIKDGDQIIDLQKMLQAINERITYLCDREKTIGHAFFVKIQTLQDLKKVFQTKIIPLLQEYFYDNYALIKAVLNDNGMIKENSTEDKKAILNCKGFKNLEDLDLGGKTIYFIAPIQDKNVWDEAQTYIDIY